MKKLLFIVSFLALVGVYSCTPDLSGIEQDIADLEQKVAELEKEVDGLNYDLKALDDFLKSGQTVKAIEDLGNGAYKITLGDGTVYTINAVTSAPVLNVSVDAEGYWTLDGERIKDASGNDVRAVGRDGENGSDGQNGQDGEDGRTPIFGVDSEGYWTVKFSEDETPVRILNADGNPVKATGPKGDAGAPGTGEPGAPGEAAPSIFKSFDVKNGVLTIILNDGYDTAVSLPIVADFYCIINNDAEGDVLFAEGETKTFAVSMKGVASAKIDVPQGWKASLDASETGEGEGTLSVTAPGAAPEVKAIIADTEKDVVVTAVSANGFSAISRITVAIDEQEPEIPEEPVDPYINLLDATGGERANCYLITAGGKYRFAADYIVAEGDGAFDNAAIVSADWLWSTGSESLLSEVSYSSEDKNIYFTVAEGAKGNAVIAALDDAGDIVWSWHIWMIDGMETPMEPHHYTRNSSWPMSDINLGATSKEVGDVNSYGLYFQWGRKDPFPASNTAGSAEASAEAARFDDMTAAYVVNTEKFVGHGFGTKKNNEIGDDDIAYTVKNPMMNVQFAAQKDGCDVGKNTWAYNMSLAEFTALWSASLKKTIYDPCPAGYAIPSATDRAWQKTNMFTKESTLNGYIFDATAGTDDTQGGKTYYPAAGYRKGGALQNPGNAGWYWTATLYTGSNYPWNLYLNGTAAEAATKTSRGQRSEFAHSVRCMKRP